jgi:hypothetical protein
MPRSKSQPSHLSGTVENVPVGWLLKAIAAVFAAAAAFIYATLCFLYSLGQWQVVLHPVHETGQPPASANLLRFAPDDTGQPQLTGQWLAAPQGGRYREFTILFLAGGDGSVSASAATIAALQNMGLNVLVFNYRGYGFSAKIHPTQQRMTEDAEAAWRYLTTTRGISAGQIIPYGTGVGASLAASLAISHPKIRALILDSPHTDLLDLARRDSPRLIPVQLLFRERFPLREPLSGLHTPKLLLANSRTATPSPFVTAADPKLTVFLPSATGSLFDQAMTRFLDEYLKPQPVPSLAPSTTNSR